MADEGFVEEGMGRSGMNYYCWDTVEEILVEEDTGCWGMELEQDIGWRDMDLGIAGDCEV